MSTTHKKFSLGFLVCLTVLCFVLPVTAQDFAVDIKLMSDAPAVLLVEGEFANEDKIQMQKSWAFLRSFAGIENLGARVSELNLKDSQKQSISYKKLIDGEYLADKDAAFWSYQININPPPNEKALAHVSWLKDEQGILILGDLLPQFGSNNQKISANIKFEVPKSWQISSGENPIAENTFNVTNVEKAVFLIGKNWRKVKTANDKLNLAISGEWNFSDAEAAQMANEIFEEYRKLFGDVPHKKSQIVLARFPKEIKFGRWEADTRGATSIIFSGDMAFKTRSLQLLHEQLRHELFHLWTPNNLALTGNYDWFYEGFTVYKALKTGVQTNQIRFEDFLDTLSEAYRIDEFQTSTISLLESSQNRWNGADSSVYSRGMLVAFLADVALLRQSRGKRSIDDVFREIYQKYRLPNQLQDGNAAILSVLHNHDELQTIIEKYIKGTEKINWRTDLSSLGIEASKTDFGTKLNVKSKIGRRQKDLLDKLGYNNWRKILK